ncbi:UDP-3-O-(3-hydroxymyristoyl)glucosamine N-acyltransferase [Helicobacter heilmannii]|uniref:UDP-3-O-acylglucosamine N-acyltransferase n=1 Tax=Helicobacter heilmannii TaxID=35817 RepID=A0A0K2YCE8_HELHE|nr:UDP-3-O-(3-hydroxymyristoyl)glucosamine N-acyltransferase [Helicobacter heilmannii]CCM11138.1 UDP-3-O-[3-hydroxymyristoyl] glucosamine N-acyltransferase [Helicobacter heilmannii ASB1.4]CRF45153.1 UDP-3-O-[3-hydroxymyristoyl] glucosamine N-acyltransferase [Helicobacter heilmannii]CRF48171.1 UDP-3-O-[3-hydroxymyristoyl] glucosamine N-acyltransferase [Helicobacter heilmannii]CRF48913.1 UDP-3-O-[3-hydroxymyristoyl] glucosamine N-acyltransferase [Helicobacter heilmannii]CRI34650.1 UDP-3-O-[3-hyd
MNFNALKETYSIEATLPPNFKDFEIVGVAPLELATPNHLSYVDQKSYVKKLKDTKAGGVLIRAEYASKVPPHSQAIITQNPHLAFAKISHAFKVDMFKTPSTKTPPNLGANVTLMPHVIVGEGVEIGDNTIIMANVVLGDGVKIGKNCKIYPNVTIYQNTQIGNEVIIHANSVIGSDGFGYAHTELGAHIKIEHTGIVQIDDFVEIGANTTIDRAVFGTTHIKQGVKIDNLVQVGHNCVLGEHSIIVSQVGLSGSTTMGRNVVLGGQVGTGGHMHIGEFTQIGGKGAVGKDLPSHTNYAGAIPAMEIHEWHHFLATLRRFAKKQKPSLIDKAKGLWKR